MAERLAKGFRRFIASTKREVRAEVAREEEAWGRIEKILTARLEGYPEKYHPGLAAIREFHVIRFNDRHGYFSNQARVDLTQANRAFQAKFNDDILDLASPAFRVISQIYSK